jgi:hypothetical protein
LTTNDGRLGDSGDVSLGAHTEDREVNTCDMRKISSASSP